MGNEEIFIAGEKITLASLFISLSQKCPVSNKLAHGATQGEIIGFRSLPQLGKRSETLVGMDFGHAHPSFANINIPH